jgi:hypothetical protein
MHFSHPQYTVHGQPIANSIIDVCRRRIDSRPAVYTERAGFKSRPEDRSNDVSNNCSIAKCLLAAAVTFLHSRYVATQIYRQRENDVMHL